MNEALVLENVPDSDKKKEKALLVFLKKHKLKITVVFLCLVLAAFLTVFFYNLNRVKLSDYLKVSFEGENSQGVLVYEYDAEGLRDAFKNKTEGLKNEIAFEYFLNSLDVSVKPLKEYSNGDKVTVVPQYNEEAAKRLGLKISKAKVKFTVSELKAPETE